MNENWLTSDRMIRGLIDGDEEIYLEFWGIYGARLQQLASKRLPDIIKRRAEPEDVVQSVCRTFFRRVQTGKLELSDSENLWRLLCAITLTKVQKQTRFHYRQKRSVNRERSISEDSQTGAYSPEPAGFEETPSQIAGFAEQFSAVLDVLDEEEQTAVQLKLDQCSEKEIAEHLKCSTRTVRRILKRVRNKLQGILEIDT